MARTFPPHTRLPQVWDSPLPVLFLRIGALNLRVQEDEDLDAHTIRLSGFWFYSQPFGSFHGTGSPGRVDFQADARFNSCSSGAGRIERKFTRKNHLYFGA